MTIGIITAVMIFSVPIIAVISSHFEKQSKLKNEHIKDQIELEKLKQENFIAETEKLKLELKKLELQQPNDLDLFK